MTCQQSAGSEQPVQMAYQTLQQEYLQIPVVTRAYTTACVLTTAAVQLEIITPFQLYFNPDLILRNYQVQILPYARGGLLQGRTADFVFMFLFGGLLMTFFNNRSQIFGTFVSLVFWARLSPSCWFTCGVAEPQRSHDFFGLLNFQAPFLPWVLMGITPAGQLHNRIVDFRKMLFDTPEEDANYTPYLRSAQEGSPGERDSASVVNHALRSSLIIRSLPRHSLREMKGANMVFVFDVLLVLGEECQTTTTGLERTICCLCIWA
ncbi:hypothetical protein INR49_002651 [Caranx melampygus]|nr:hypothetical protein INR49_002651 [Caranx melampygus]